MRGLLLLGHEGHGAVLVFFSPKVSYVHGRKPEVLQRSFVLFFPSNKTSLQISCCPFRKKTLETPLELCTGGQLKFLESQFRGCLGAVHSQNSHSTLSTLFYSIPLHSTICNLFYLGELHSTNLRDLVSSVPPAQCTSSGPARPI